MARKDVYIVVAATLQGGIGLKGRLPWNLRGDMDHFRRVTTEAEAGKQNAVIMGRKTFESIPEANRPLRGRFNIVLSRNDSYRDTVPAGVACYHSLNHAIEECNQRDESLQRDDLKYIWLTRVKSDCKCDTFMDPIDKSIFEDDPTLPSGSFEENGIPYEILLLRRRCVAK
eukprot:gene3015-5799_t